MDKKVKNKNMLYLAIRAIWEFRLNLSADINPDPLTGQTMETIFMQDGVSSHTAHQTVDFFGKFGIRLLSGWPTLSPDLNPIETVWAGTKCVPLKDVRNCTLEGRNNSK